MAADESLHCNYSSALKSCSRAQRAALARRWRPVWDEPERAVGLTTVERMIPQAGDDSANMDEQKPSSP
jgi:hypothetical protein